VSVGWERKAMLDKLIEDAEAKVAAMHPVRRWIGWRMVYLRKALKSDGACLAYLWALLVLLGVDLYRIPMRSWGIRSEWEGPRDIRLIWWHPVAWPLAALAVVLMVLVGGIALVVDNGNPFRKRKHHRKATS